MPRVRMTPSSLLKAEWPNRLLIIGFGSLLLYLAGAYLGGETSLDRVLRDVGIAGIIAVLIAYTVDRLMHYSLLETIRGSSNVMRGAADLYVEDLFARGKEEEGRSRWTDRVQAAVRAELARREGDVLILCVAAPEFFRRHAPVGELLWEFAHDDGGVGNGAVRVLLSCPTSASCLTRARLEVGHPTIGDVYNAAEYLFRLCRDAEERKRSLKFKCNSKDASVFLVITDEWLFLEAYPLAKIAPDDVPLGGRTPMLMLSKKSPAYERWRLHFEYAWNESQDFDEHHAGDERWQGFVSSVEALQS